jgi:SAM-dependent methyltransferase
LAARNRNRSNSEVFSEIYRRNRWGGNSEFFSGQGSRLQSIVGPYVAAIASELTTRYPGSSVVDLGCGDFEVGRQLLPYCASYCGVDVVPDLIAELRERHASPRVTFRLADITEEDMPQGDICLIRQVFQHLSNQEIAAVLGRLGAFRAVYVTEQVPIAEHLAQPNLDKTHGPDMRLWRDSGIYLDQAPFDLPSEALTAILEVPGQVPFAHFPAGVIRTVRYIPANARDRDRRQRFDA